MILFNYTLIFRFYGDGGIDNDSANSRDALIEELKPSIKRRYSNASQSSHDKLKYKQDKLKYKQEKMKSLDDPLNVGSVVGIDRLFESSDCALEPRTNKSIFNFSTKHLIINCCTNLFLFNRYA